MGYLSGSKGIDVSHFQTGLDYKKVKASGVKFVILKASEGASYKDTTFVSNARAARVAGLIIGAYHFWRAGQSATAQANNYLTAISQLRTGLFNIGGKQGLLPGEIVPIIDMEDRTGVDRNGLTPAGVTHDMGLWLDVVSSGMKLKAGNLPMIYGDRDFIDTNLLSGYEGHPLWLAQYGVNPGAITLPKLWKRCAVHQYTDQNRAIPGTQGQTIDTNFVMDGLPIIT